MQAFIITLILVNAAVLGLETWPEAMATAGGVILALDRAILAAFVLESFPYAWAFFIPFILVATFTMLNLFIAIIVNAMQSYNEQEQQSTVTALEQTRDHIETDMHAELLALRGEIRELKTLLLARGGTGGPGA